jgi:hypothetical protein
MEHDTQHRIEISTSSQLIGCGETETLSTYRYGTVPGTGILRDCRRDDTLLPTKDCSAFVYFLYCLSIIFFLSQTSYRLM